MVRSLPLGIYRNQPVRSLWLDTFDRLSAPLENRYGWETSSPGSARKDWSSSRRETMPAGSWSPKPGA